MADSVDTAEFESNLTFTDHDILFECPACGKSLVADQMASNQAVECPRCHVQIVVPPRLEAEPLNATPQQIGPDEITTSDIVFHCPVCSQRLVIDLIATGFSVECPGCSVQVVVPDRSEPVESNDMTGGDSDLMMAAVATGDARQVQEVLARVGDVNARNASGWTALMEAARRGNQEVVAALIARGADVQAADPRGETALTIAMHSDNFHIARVLWKAGARSSGGLGRVFAEKLPDWFQAGKS